MSEDAPEDGPWSLEERRMLTAVTLQRIREDGGPGEDVIVTMAFEFLPGAGSDLEACQRALKMFGYEGEMAEGALTVEVPEVALNTDAIWLHEERLITICEARGFEPDGWGFYH